MRGSRHPQPWLHLLWRGLLATIGLGAAAVTPIGWVLAAGAASAGAYYGVTRAINAHRRGRITEIPEFINTPLDVLAVELVDLIGTLALKVASIDGVVHEDERAVVREHLVLDWGLDRSYVEKAILVIEEGVPNTNLKDCVDVLVKMARKNTDCDLESLRRQVLQLKDVCEADGFLDEREDLALEKVGALFAPA